jgi:hypothetical protein
MFKKGVNLGIISIVLGNIYKRESCLEIIKEENGKKRKYS